MEVEGIVSDYFQHIFSSSNPTRIEEVLEGVQGKVTGSMNSRLVGPVTMREVCAALFQMEPSKAPGPDGMTVAFF